MIDWFSSMSQTFEFFEVNPNTWQNKRRLSNVLSCSINRDLDSGTLETASFEVSARDKEELKALGFMQEMYIRVYMVIGQNGSVFRECLGTFMVQTPSVTFDGRFTRTNLVAYSPLLELKDAYLPLGYSILKNKNIMDNARAITREYLRCPVGDVSSPDTLTGDFISEPDESVLDYVSTLMSNAKYYYILDETSGVYFAPIQKLETLQPKWTFSDDNSSILYPSVTDDFDLYGIPNVVEVIYSGEDGTQLYYKAVNDNPESPTSTVARGREVLYRELSPQVNGECDQAYIERYAIDLLKALNSIEHTISYSHGYCPVRIGDCVRLNYERAGLKNVKAKVISQSIDCTSGCVVTEKAVYTSNLWKED